MASPYSAWADSLTFAQSAFLNTLPISDISLPSADPTGGQPFTTSKNVSFPEQETPHRLPRAAAMAKKRHFSQHSSLAPASKLVDMQHAANPHNQPEVPCNIGEHCHFSPACDRPDCDESTKCFDHAAHDIYPCNNDLSWCQDHFRCDDVFACEGEACNFDFGDCNFLPCPEVCDEVDCHEPQHSQDCKGSSACPTVACGDPQCDEPVLYCCLSDICPHKSHADCHQPCLPDCRESHNHCTTLLPAQCHPPCHSSGDASCPSPLQDNMSISTISTPQTDLSDNLQTPTSLHFQSLVEAATTQAFLNAPGNNGWDMPSFNDSLTPQRKRRKMDSRSDEQSLYEAKVMDQTFMKPEQGLQDAWQDYTYQFTPDFLFTGPQSIPTLTDQQRQQSRPKSMSQSSSSIPPEGLICRWHDEKTGTCNTAFTSSEDFHNHVKEHTSTLVGNRGANRDYKCRWLGCDKTDPFGTKNHLDRHMQNHTGFKPFACNICGHRCVTHQQLTNHLTTHTRSKPFVCDFPGCTKSFSVKTALSTHKRTHTNDKPFGCRFCGDKYADSSNLSKHRKTVHEDERTSIPCPEPGCAYRDSRCQRLERHCRDKAHGVELYSDPMKWAEYTGRWKRKPPASFSAAGRSRTASVAVSTVSGGV